MKKLLVLTVLALTLFGCENEGPDIWTVPLTIVIPPDIIMELESTDEVIEPMLIMYSLDSSFGNAGHLMQVTKAAAKEMGAEILESEDTPNYGMATLNYLTMDDIQVNIGLFYGTS